MTVGTMYLSYSLLYPQFLVLCLHTVGIQGIFVEGMNECTILHWANMRK